VEHTLLIVDPGSRRELAKVLVGVNGHEVTLSKDGRFAYVPIYGNSGVGRPGTDGSSIDIVDLQTRTLAGSIDLGRGVRPHKAEFGPDGLLYVTAELANDLYVVDVNARKVVAEIPTGQPEAHMLVLSPDGRRAYTANVGPGSVSVLDVEKRKLITVIPVAKRVQRISRTLDGRLVFTHDQDKPRMAVIDTATNKIKQWVELPEVAYASAPTSDGKWLLVVSAAGKLHVVDLATLTIDKSFEVPPSANVVTVQPDGTIAYISCMQVGKIAVLNLRSWQMEEPISLTPGVDGSAWMTSGK
jgi:YVTN family beta-propeller protein